MVRSFRLEEAKLNGLQVPVRRDFRSRAERLADNGPEAQVTRENGIAVSTRVTLALATVRPFF